MKTYSFLSTYPMLSVVVDPGGSTIVAGTTQVQNIPPRIIKFKHGVYNTVDEPTALLMVKRLILDRRYGRASTYLPHPECLDMINDLVKRTMEDEMPIELPKAPEVQDQMPSADGEMVKQLSASIDEMKKKMAEMEDENRRLMEEKAAKPMRQRVSKTEDNKPAEPVATA